MKRLDIPVIAVISDHQRSIVLGVQKALPGVKHQFCHFHVLRNALLPMANMDRKLKKDLRIRIRGIAGIERSLDGRDDADASTLRNACSLLRALLIYPETVPLEFSGMVVFQHLASLDGVLRRMSSSRKDGELDRLVKITGRWREFIQRYRDISSLVRYANELRRILSLNISSGDAMKLMEDFLPSLKAKASEGGIYSSLDAMIEAIEHHWPGLFYCFDDSRIPRTDNGLEITIRRNKVAYRRMTGMRSWDSYIAQYGRSTYMIPPDVTRDDLITMAGDVDRREYMKRWKEFESRMKVQSLMRTARNDDASSLRSLEKTWNPA